MLFLAEQNIKHTVVKGALILTVSNVIVKIIGALFTIPLIWIIGEEGMGNFGIAYTIYTTMFALGTAGLPVTLSRMIASSNALGRYKEPNRILVIGFSLYASISLFVSLSMILWAGNITALMGNKDAALALMAIAPAVLFISGDAALKGYFQGFQKMEPTAITNIIESGGKLIFGLLFAWYLLKQGKPLYVVAAGASAGVALGAVLSAVYMALSFFKSKRSIKFTQYMSAAPSRPYKPIFKEFVMTAVPILIGALTINLSSLIDTGVFNNRLQTSGLTLESAKIIFGSYTTMAVKMFTMPIIVISSICVTLLPAIAAAFAVKNRARVKNAVNGTLRITSIMAMPAAVGILVLARPILNLIFSGRPVGVSIAAPLLNILGIAIFTLSLSQVSNSMLQAIGKPQIPVFNFLIGGTVKFIINFILIGMPSIRAIGAPIGTNVCYLIIMILNFLWLKKYLGFAPDFKAVLAKPFIAAAACGVTAFGVNKYSSELFQNLLKNISHGMFISNALSLLLAVGIGGIIYILILFMVKGMSIDDILLLPFGKKLAKTLENKGKIR